MITAWDPGVTTGFAVWTNDWEFLEMGDCQPDELVQTWQRLEEKYGVCTIAVIEDYRLFMKRARAQRNSNMPASKAIGKLEAMRDLSKGATRIVMQPASVKTMAMRFVGMEKMPSDHALTHCLDAFLHGSYYGVEQGKLKTALSKKKEQERG